MTSVSLSSVLIFLEQCFSGPIKIEVETTAGVKRSSEVISEIVAFAEEHSIRVKSINVTVSSGFSQHIYIWFESDWPSSSRYDLQLELSEKEAADVCMKLDEILLEMRPSYNALARFPVVNVLFASVLFCFCVVPVVRLVWSAPTPRLDSVLAAAVILVFCLDGCVVCLAIVRRKFWPGLRFSLQRKGSQASATRPSSQ